MNKKYDAIIIGAGHNGLVAAAYLAKAGKSVLVLERRHITGGLAVTEELFPGFKFSPCSNAHFSLLPQIIRDLDLRKHGLEILTHDPLVFTPMPDDNHLVIWRQTEKTVKEIERFSEKDAANFLRFDKLMNKLTRFIGLLHSITPPKIAPPNLGELLQLLKFGYRFRKLGKKDMENAMRILPMSVADFLDEWFETDVLKGAIAASGITGNLLGPMSSGTAYILLHHRTGNSDGAFGSSGFVRGGMGSLSKSISQAAQKYGAEIRTEAEIAQILIKDEKAAGVVLKNGDEIYSNMIVSNADPKRTFLKLVAPGHFDAHFLLQVRNIKMRGCSAKVNLALSELPNFTCITDKEKTFYLKGNILIAPDIEYLERAYDDAKHGSFSRRPYLDISIPSLSDPTLAPEGKHVMSIYMQYAPYHLKDGNWNDKREELCDLIIDTLSEYAPNFKDSILHKQILTPLDLEEIYGLTEGHIFHGELTLDQLFFMRPVPGWAQYRTPIKNLYLCGSGTHPGSGITGASGYNAAREILKNWKKGNIHSKKIRKG